MGDSSDGEREITVKKGPGWCNVELAPRRWAARTQSRPPVICTTAESFTSMGSLPPRDRSAMSRRCARSVQK